MLIYVQVVNLLHLGLHEKAVDKIRRSLQVSTICGEHFPPKYFTSVFIASADCEVKVALF
jgi:hypothetical protein